MAAISRTSTVISRVPPSRRNVLVSSTFRSLGWSSGARSPISSRKIVPRSEISNSPCFRSLASVNAPFSCPNSSESRKVALSPAQLTSTNGAFERGLRSWIIRATQPLPVPLSPLSSTVVRSLCARRPTWWAKSCMPDELPSESSPWSGALCTSSASLIRRSRALSATRAVAAARCSMSTGLVRKFSAPSCIARTAIETSASAVSRMTAASRCRRASSTSMPFMPGSRRSRITTSGRSRSKVARPASPLSSRVTSYPSRSK